MIRVNLLPIREEARQRDLKQQLMLLGLVVIAAGWRCPCGTPR